MVDREIFSRRLEALLGYSSKLAAFREVSKAEFVREPAIHDLAERLRGWAGFRNVLVHEYLDIDHAIAYRAIQTELSDLDRLGEWATAKLE
jgi:hypothetical protein